MPTRQIITTVVGIAAFILLAVLMWCAMRWLSKKGFGGGRSKHMEVIDRLVVSRESYILILRVSDRIFAVSFGGNSSGMICELDASAFGSRDKGNRSDVFSGTEKNEAKTGFWVRFWHNIKLNIGMMPNGTKPMTPHGNGDTQGESPEPFKSVFDRISRKQEDESEHVPSTDPKTEAATPHHVFPDVNMKQIRPKYERYNALIENMRILGLVGAEGCAAAQIHARRVARMQPVQHPPAETVLGPQTAQVPEPPKPEISSSPKEPDRYDVMFDMIARRQSRYTGRKKKPDELEVTNDP